MSSVEVVSFGNSLFFRSLEKPKPFLVPVTDYEVMEARETRSVLKKAQIDKIDKKLVVGNHLRSRKQKLSRQKRKKLLKKTPKNVPANPHVAAEPLKKKR